MENCWSRMMWKSNPEGTQILDASDSKHESAGQRLQGVKESVPETLSVESIKTHLPSLLNLNYVPEDWQCHLIHRLLQGSSKGECHQLVELLSTERYRGEKAARWLCRDLSFRWAGTPGCYNHLGLKVPVTALYTEYKCKSSSTIF